MITPVAPCYKDEHFPLPLLVEVLPPSAKSQLGRTCFVLREDFKFHEPDYNVTYTVRAGFATDFASIPAVVRGIIDNDDPNIMFAAVIHDANYRGLLEITMHVGTTPTTWATHHDRETADDLLIDIMKVCGAPKWKQRAVWLSVRAFGWRFFDKRSTEGHRL